MIKQLQTSRTCVACGQKKPLVAFLELAGAKGHTYGDICASCRGSGQGRKKLNEEPGEKSDGTTNLRLQIDNKTKVQIEHEKQEQHKQHEELDYEEKIKKESLEEKTSSETEQRKETEKKYREDYLAQKKQNLVKPTKTDPSAAPASRENQSIQTQGFYQEKARVTKEFNTQVSEQQLGKKTTGLSPEYINRYVSATGRSAKSLFGQLLGQFMANHFQAQGKAAGPHAGQQKPNQAPKASTEASEKLQEASKAEGKENIAVEFIKNNFKR